MFLFHPQVTEWGQVLQSAESARGKRAPDGSPVNEPDFLSTQSHGREWRLEFAA